MTPRPIRSIPCLHLHLHHHIPIRLFSVPLAITGSPLAVPTSRVTDKVVHRSLRALDGFLSFPLKSVSSLFFLLGLSPPCRGVFARGCVQACARGCVRVHAGVCVWTCARMQVCACACVCVHAGRRVRAGADTHACRRPPPLHALSSAAVALRGPRLCCRHIPPSPPRCRRLRGRAGGSTVLPGLRAVPVAPALLPTLPGCVGTPKTTLQALCRAAGLGSVVPGREPRAQGPSTRCSLPRRVFDTQRTALTGSGLCARSGKGLRHRACFPGGCSRGWLRAGSAQLHPGDRPHGTGRCWMLQVHVSGVPREQIFDQGFAGLQPVPGLPPALWVPGRVVFACVPMASVQRVVLGEHRAGRAHDGDKGAKLFPWAFSPCWVAQSLMPARAAWAPLGVTAAHAAEGRPSPIAARPVVPPRAPSVTLLPCTIHPLLRPGC